MQPDSALLLERTGGVTTLRFNRPRQRNAFTSGMTTALGEALESLAGDSDCRVIVLRGVAGHFCSGWDFNELDAMRSSGDVALANQFSENLKVLDRLEHHPKVTVSLVEGSTMGFGFSLAARSDLVLATDTSRFALPEISLGIVPAIVMADVQRYISPKFALDWLLSGREIDAEEARRAAFLSRVFPSTEFEHSTQLMITQIAGYSASVLTQTKKLFRQLRNLPASTAEQVAIDAAIEALNAPAAKEGIAALIEKRKPNWPE